MLTVEGIVENVMSRNIMAEGGYYTTVWAPETAARSFPSISDFVCGNRISKKIKIKWFK